MGRSSPPGIRPIVSFKTSEPWLCPAAGLLALAGESRRTEQGNRSGQEARAQETWAVQCLWALGTSAFHVSRKRRITYMGPIDRGEESTRSLLEICSLYVLPCPCTSAEQHRRCSHPVSVRCLRCLSPVRYLVSVIRKLWRAPFPMKQGCFQSLLSS